MSNSGTRTDRLRRWIGRLPQPGLSELIQWWPTIWPFAVAAAVTASALAVFVMTAIPFAVQTALVAFGAFAGTVWGVRWMRTHWTPVVRFVRRSGFSIKRRGLHVNSFRNQAGQRRDLIVWSDLQQRITGASVVGFNYSNKPIFDVKVHARSLKTNQVINGYLNGMPPEATYGLPGRCEFAAFVNFEASTPDREGLTAEDFRDFIGDFELVVSGDGTEKVVRFPMSLSEAKIQESIDRMEIKRSPTAPRVAKRPVETASDPSPPAENSRQATPYEIERKLRAIDETVVPLLDGMRSLINEGERLQSAGWNAFRDPANYPDYRSQLKDFRDRFAVYGRELAAVSEELAAHSDIVETLAFPAHAQCLRAIGVYMNKYDLFAAYVDKGAPRDTFAAFMEADANAFGKAVIEYMHWCSETRARVVALQRSLSP